MRLDPVRPFYQWLLVGLLSLNFGVVFFDRNAMNYLMPFIQPELGMSNTNVGALGAALALSWAASGLFIGRLSDLLGRRKLILVFCTVFFSCASFLSGLAPTFVALVAVRLLMGVAEGGVMPISQVLIAAEVNPKRRGLAMGLAQTFGANLFGTFLGPVVVVAVALAFGWRKAFFLAALPGLLMALVMYFFIVEPPKTELHHDPAIPRGSALREVLADRNIQICAVISVLLVAFMMVFFSFMPLYLIRQRGVSQTTMSWLMATYGLGSMACSVLVSGASDYFGRRPVTIAAGALGALIPLGGLFIHGALWPLFGLFLIGSAYIGAFPIVMATIPSETVQPRLLATTMGLTMGAGEIIGGAGGPLLAGKFADLFGLRAPLWILIGLVAAIVVFGLLLRETATTRSNRHSLDEIGVPPI